METAFADKCLSISDLDDVHRPAVRYEPRFIDVGLAGTLETDRLGRCVQPQLTNCLKLTNPLGAHQVLVSASTRPEISIPPFLKVMWGRELKRSW